MVTLQRRFGWGSVALLPCLVLAALMYGVLPDPIIGAPRSHLIVVATTAALLALLAVLMALAALQVRDTRVFFLALAFLCISGIFLAHALTTPGVLVPYVNPWVGFSAYFSLFLGAVCLAFSALDWPAAAARFLVARQKQFFLLALIALALYNAVAFTTASTPPTIASAIPVPAQPTIATAADGYGYGALAAAHAGHATVSAPAPESAGGSFVGLGAPWVARWLTIVTLALLALTIGRYARRNRLAPSPLLAGLLVASIFLAQAHVVMLITTIWHASWWEYHLLMLLAFVAAALGLAREYARSGSLAGVVSGLLLRDTIGQLEHGYTEAIVALVAAVEAKDPYTRGHSQRVAALAVRLGEELRLSPERLRTLGRAAILHDIGKIGVPDAVLNKPGPLTAAERASIQEHPARGDAIIGGIRSLRRERGGVRAHHERLDGSGYPDGLRGEAIPLEARIIAVADTYDALTSQRAYRAALPPARALAIIAAEAGDKLDPRCVAALPAALARAGAQRPADPTDRRRVAPEAEPWGAGAD
jgi:HD-GYP domain-containing protein (c-di-GMP phosphodiesterase class II)